MSQNKQLANSLTELSDAIRQLAEILQNQSNTDNQVHIKQFSLIVKRFSATTHQIQQPPNEIKAKHKKGFIQQWLGQKNMAMVDGNENLKADDYLFHAVDYLADHYLHLKEFYSQLKRHQSLKKNFTHQTTRQSIEYIQRWCNMLHQQNMIDSFNITNSTDIYVDIAEVHAAANFIYGYWLEVLLRKEVAVWFNNNLSNIESFDIVSQAYVLKPDKTKTELDLLIMVNGKVYWFECKSGDINRYYKKFNEHRKTMQLGANNSFLVIPDKNGPISLEALKSSGMSTLSGTELEVQLPQFLKL